MPVRVTVTSSVEHFAALRVNLHMYILCMGPDSLQGPNRKYSTVELFTLVQNRDRDQDALFPIVTVQFPAPVPVPYNVNKP